MDKKLLMKLAVFVLVVGLSGAAWSLEFSDDFNTPHDYRADGVAKTGWDGFVGKSAGETVDVLQADINHPNELYIKSTGSHWDAPWKPLGPFLYKEVTGDFIATVHVADYIGLDTHTQVNHNNCGLMARASRDPNNDVAGTGEDWVSIDYFPIWGVGIIARHCDNGSRTEDVGGDGKAWDADRYLQLERRGNTFYLRTSPDGKKWREYPDPAFTGLERADFDGLPLQVGLFHATYSDNTGYAAFDDFSIKPVVKVKPPPTEDKIGKDANTAATADN